ncbi:MAG: 3-hydroxybutyryl-CoA dehydrogenase [Saprospiraceae bacterium]|nr:3-hydroxybutyryl-CoA dehydrogenase [Saprospiraceae bacterium]
MQHITVIGAGTMGNGIAQVFATHHYHVTLCDVSAPALEKALKTISGSLDRLIKKESITENDKSVILSHISTNTDLKSAVEKAELIIEAATENEEIKLRIFKDMDQYAPDNCILATNTSSISITKIAGATSRPDKVIGMHFMNPVPVMVLIEIIRGYNTSDEVCSTITELSKKIHKTPLEVNDYPGFVANRILMPMINEAIHTLHEGVAGVAEIDGIMKLGMAHPMGPLALADFIGLDVCLSILKVMFQGFGNPKYAPSPLLVNMVTAGKLGRKSGEGFYVYTEGSKDLIVSPNFTKS